MKFAAKAANLAAAAAQVAKISPVKNTIPILGHTLLRVDGSGLHLVGHDLDRSLAVAVEADVSKPGAATADAKRFAKLLAAIDGETQVKVSADEKGLTLQAGRSRYKFDALIPEDFPEPLKPGQDVEEGRDPPPLEEDRPPLAEMMLDEAARHQLFEMTQFAISTEETRYYLNGVFLTATDGRATGVATDGHRIVRNFATVTLAGNWPAIIVPRPAVASIVALAAAKLVSDGRILQAMAEGIVFASKTIDGTYPDWRRVVPQPSDNTIEFDVDEMLGALKRMQAVADKDDVSKRGGVCKLMWAAGSDSLTLMLKADAAEDVVAGTVGDLDGGFACSIRYLTESLENLNAERVIIDSADPGSPVRIMALGNDDGLSVVMPMRW